MSDTFKPWTERTPADVARSMADALELRAANGGEIASFGIIPDAIRRYVETLEN